MSFYQNVIERGNYQILESFPRSRCRVFRVGIEDDMFVMKLPDIDRYDFGVHHILREALVLERAGSVDGVPALMSLESGLPEELQEQLIMQGLDPDIFYKLLRTYIPGSTAKDKRVGFEFRGYLHDIVRYFHGSGMANLDLRPDNVILQQDTQMPHLIDFGSVEFEGETGDFRGLVNRDMRNLELLFLYGMFS